MPLDLLLLGPPGAGKGTQAMRIAEDYQIPQIGTGDMLRSAVAAGTELGKRAKAVMDSGALVPDDVIVGVMRERLAAGDTDRGFVLDGFPRTIPQAEALDSMLEELGRRIAAVLELQLDEEEAVRRLERRSSKEGRSDDTPETIRRRMQVYRAQTEPLVAYYLGRSVLVGIDAGRTVDGVYSQIDEVLERLR